MLDTLDWLFGVRFHKLKSNMTLGLKVLGLGWSKQWAYTFM